MDDTLFDLQYAGKESYSDTAYFYDNRERGLDPLTCVIQRTMAGCGFYETGGIRQEVRAGQAMLFIQGEDSRYGYSEEGAGVYQLEYVALGGRLIRPVFEQVQDKVGSVFSLPDGSVAEVYFQNLVSSYIARRFTDRFQQSLLIYELFMSLLQFGGDEASRKDPVERAKEYILHNYQTPITQEDVATHAGISREHLARRYTQQFAVSPGRHCTKLRMERARMLLRIISHPIEHVALNCGYTDASSFGRAFKAAYGMSPSAFRINRCFPYTQEISSR